MYTALTEDILSVIKAPPLKPPTVAWSTDSTNTDNNVVNYIFQFSGRFRYDDYEKSVWGPISDILVIDDHYTGLGTTTYFFRTRNRIELVFEIPDDETLIELDIGVRVGNNGVWYLSETVDVTAYRGSTYTHYFYNNKVSSALDQKNFFRPYDYVPLLAGAQQIIGGADGAYLTYGDNTEGFNGVDVSTATFAAKTTLHSIIGMTPEQVTPTAGTSRTYICRVLVVGSYGYSLTIVANSSHWRFVYPYLRYWKESTSSVEAVSVADFKAYIVKLVNDSDAPVTA